MSIIDERRHGDRLRSASKDREVKRLEIKEIRLLREAIERLLERLPLATKERSED